MGFEVILTYISVLSQNDYPIKFVEFYFGLMGVFFLYHLILDFTKKNKLISVLLSLCYMLSPAVLVQLGATRNDLSANSFFIGFLLFLCKFLQEPKRIFSVYSGICLGLMLQMKPINLISALVFYTVTLVYFYCHSRKLLIHAFKNIWISAAVAVLVGGFWYAKNAFVYSSPLPLEIISSTRSSLLDFSDFYGFLIADIRRLFDQGAYFTSDLGEGAGYGVQFWFLVFPAIIMPFFISANKHEDRNILIFSRYFISACIICFLVLVHQFTRNNPWNFRYFSWLSIVVYVGSAMVYRFYASYRFFIFTAFFLALIYGTLSAYAPDGFSSRNFMYLLSKNKCQRSGAYTARFMPEEIRYVVDNVPAESPVTYIRSAGRPNFVYSLVDPCWDRKINFCDPAKESDLIGCMEKGNSRVLVAYSTPLNEYIAKEKAFIQLKPGVFIRE